jgi:hypothetical protein
MEVAELHFIPQLSKLYSSGRNGALTMGLKAKTNTNEAQTKGINVVSNFRVGGLSISPAPHFESRIAWKEFEYNESIESIL